MIQKHKQSQNQTKRDKVDTTVLFVFTLSCLYLSYVVHDNNTLWSLKQSLIHCHGSCHEISSPHNSNYAYLILFLSLLLFLLFYMFQNFQPPECPSSTNLSHSSQSHSCKLSLSSPSSILLQEFPFWSSILSVNSPTLIGVMKSSGCRIKTAALFSCR